MMKKYNTPEIVALALETVDVITNSGAIAAANALAADPSLAGQSLNVATVKERFEQMDNLWSW